MHDLLERLGLHRPELRAWAMYDWANSVFATTVLQVFPIYFARVAARDLPPAAASARFAAATTVAMAAIAVLSPLLGVLADHAPIKKPLLGGFLALAIISTAGMFTIGTGDWRLGMLLIALGNIGNSGSSAFYDALLPHVARPDEMDRVSTAGFALGYLGGGLLLALNLAWIQFPHAFGIADAATATRLSFLSAAVWWVVFSIPMFRRVPEPPCATDAVSPRSLGGAFARLGEVLSLLRRYPQALLMLLAFLVYNDGINTIIRMGTAYGTEIGIATGALLAAVLLINFVSVPFAFLFGMLARRLGPKRAIFVGLATYVVISGVGYFMRTAAHFFLLSVLVAMAMGGTQALSRSLFASLIPRQHSAEFFSFYGISDKFAGVLGPALFATMAGTFASSRPAILSLVAFFVVGGLLLFQVDVESGQAVAREAEAARPAMLR
jgi:UMF1 family MFS transporter